MGYVDWRRGGWSGGVDEDFERIDDELSCILYLSISESLIILTSNQHIISEIYAIIELIKLRLN